MNTNFISKSLEFIELLINEKIAGGYFCLNEMSRKILTQLSSVRGASQP